MSYRDFHFFKNDETVVELRHTWIDPALDIWAWKVHVYDHNHEKYLFELEPGDGTGMTLPRALVVAAAWLAHPVRPGLAQRFVDAACACIKAL